MHRPIRLQSPQRTFYLSACAWVITALVGQPSPTLAQSGDASVAILDHPPVSRSGEAAGAPVVLHATGDLVIAADGILRVSASGAERWHHADPMLTDVATGPSGAIFGVGLPGPLRRRSVRLTRLGNDGVEEWTRVLHRGQQHQYSTVDIAGAPDDSVLVCTTLRRGRRVAPQLTKVSAAGDVVWTRQLAAEGQCNGVVADEQGIYWAGGRAHDNSDWVGIVQALGMNGRVRWEQRYDSHVLFDEVVAPGNGAVVVGGSFIGPTDLLPGPRRFMASSHGYQSFVTRFESSGEPDWAWAADESGGVASLLLRGDRVLVVRPGYLNVLDADGTELRETVFGFFHRPDWDQPSAPSVSVSGATFDRQGRVVLVGGIPEGDFFHLFDEVPFGGSRGGFVAAPGW